MSGCAIISERGDQQALGAIESQFTNLSATATVLGQKRP